jgi:hypothetical protein
MIYNSIKNLLCISLSSYNMRDLSDYKNEYLWIDEQVVNEVEDNISLYKYLDNPCQIDSMYDINYYQYTLNQIIIDNHNKYSINKIESVDDIQDILIAVIVNFQYDSIYWDLNKNITISDSNNEKSILDSDIVDCGIKFFRDGLLNYDNNIDIEHLNPFYNTDSYFHIIYIYIWHIN